jgi:anaerobic dimethyl sulfoxide reductase subunit A
VVYDADRLKYPLKRVGGRGEGKLERITWEEAYEAIVQSLKEIKKKHGPESVIFCHGTARDRRSGQGYTRSSTNRIIFTP